MTESESNELKRSVSWKQGMFIALGVPLLILPSIYDVSSIVWGLCIVVWSMSVLQGFVQNLAYGEMVTVFPKATGLPGCAQTVFTPEVQTSRYDKGKLIGAFSAWCYWFAWTPVVAIFTMLIGDYLIQMFEMDVSGWAGLGVYMGVGIAIVLIMLVLGSRGLEGGATFGTILAIVSIVPMVVILIGAFATGMFDFSNITEDFTTPTWTWSAEDVVLLLGCFGLAQWSACAWETAAIYGPEYKNPGRDVPKALFACGIICLILYFFVSTTVFGSLGATGIDGAGYASFVPISEHVFGHAGSYVALGLLIVAMVLIIQTGFLGSSRTLHSMAQEGNLPSWFSKLNKNGMPTNAMLFVSIFNLVLIFLVGYSAWVLDSGDTVMTILSASAMGYCIANGIALAAYVKTKTNPRFRGLERPFRAPIGWRYVITIMTGVQFFVWLPCLIYWSYYLSGGYTPVILGAVIILAFIPIWYWVQKKASAESF
ncbi:MAG: APC family permease [Candidatus Methanoplasma sp.]|jgi:amino acid transporter|nr:APC family permease [Candidatus Methanoplasma sp.]